MKFVIPAIIEMPSGSIYKYEIDKKTDGLVLDRTLKVRTPYSYGYIPDTLQKDGDPLDIFVISDDPLIALSKVKAEIIGIVKCTDNGVEDDKVIAILQGLDKEQYPKAIQDIIGYLETYKEGFVVNKFEEVQQAILTYQLSLVWQNPVV